MNKIKRIYLLVLVFILSLFIVACGENKVEKDNETNKYGDELGLMENGNRTFVANLDYAIGTAYKWYYESSINKVVNLVSEEVINTNPSVIMDGGRGKYVAKFEADIDLANDRRITLTFTYNDSEKTDKHPKTYEFTMYVTFDGEIRYEGVVSKNLNGPDESEHKWNHIDAVMVTCEHDGHTAYDVCEICGEKRGYEKFIALGGDHDFALSSDSPFPTKEMPIHAEYTCKKCGITKGDYGNVLNKNKEEMSNLSILLIGNSYTNYNTMKLALEGIIKGEGMNATIVNKSVGSQYLYNYVEGANYHYRVTDALKDNDFDVVFLQDQSTNPAVDPANFYDNARILHKFFTEKGITCIMYETWTRKGGYSSKGWSEFEMAQRLCASYTAIGQELEISVSHCGTAVYNMMQKYKSIPSHNSDNSHPSTYSSYLVALCHYATLYGRSPIGINYKYNDYLNNPDVTWHADNARTPISDEMQTALEKLAYDAVFGPSMLTSTYMTSSVGVTHNN